MATLLDHAGLAGTDLARMRAAFGRLGFTVTEPSDLLGRANGVIRPLGQSSAHVVFEDTYLELTAVATPSPAHHLAGYGGRYDGLQILALRTDDLAQAHARAQRAGAMPGAIAEASRPVDYGAGARCGEARFEWFAVAPGCSPEGLTCLIRHLTPALVFQPAVQRHPNGALELEAVWVVSPQPAAAAARLAELADAGSEATDWGHRVALGHGRIEFAAADSFARRFPGAHAPAAASFAGVSVRVADVGAVQRLLEAAAVPHRMASQGRIWVLPESAAGTVVEFVA